jgi:uncharacterized SAM-binding protein YcdF (DUF218 family)
MKWLLVLVVGAGCLITATRLATVWLLTQTDQPVRADLLVVLSGGSAERIETALDLFQQGLAPRILITDPEGFPDPAFRWLERQGVPHRALMAPTGPAASTLEDALCIREAALRDGFKSVLVVTSPYHCRRARAILTHVLEPLGVRVTVVRSASYYMDAPRWWRSAQGWRLVPAEIGKLIWWSLLGRHWASGDPKRTAEPLGSA